MQPNRLVIFVKAPRPGEVKTRLEKTIGAAGALSAYETLVKTLVKRLAKLPEAELRYTPDDASAEVQDWIQPGWTAAPQGPGDLGQRLQRAFDQAFASGARHVVIIGSDCPGITPRDIEDAWKALPDHDMVAGPSLDGGYWLIGLRQPQPSLFEGIPWSTERVLGETLKKARDQGLHLHLLRMLTDVDTEKEWIEFLKDL
jgi:uncharacterized protein